LFLLAMNVRGIIFQEERCPTSGAPHLQGFLRLDTARDIDRVKRMFGDERQHVHLEISVSPFKAVEYCRKGETRMGECYEEGDLVFEQGKSSELAEVIELIRNGSSYREIAEQYPKQCILHSRGLQSTQFWLGTPTSFRTLNNYVLSGSSGVGKTRSVYATRDRVYKLDRSASSGNVWFDGYDGQSTLLIDDFYGWIPYGQLLNILDGYTLRLDIKGGHTWAGWTSVIITSNKSPHEWYRDFSAGCSPALARRLHHWIPCDNTTTFAALTLALSVEPCPFGPPIGREYSATSVFFNDLPSIPIHTNTAPAQSTVADALRPQFTAYDRPRLLQPGEKFTKRESVIDLTID